MWLLFIVLVAVVIFLVVRASKLSGLSAGSSAKQGELSLFSRQRIRQQFVEHHAHGEEFIRHRRIITLDCFKSR